MKLNHIVAALAVTAIGGCHESPENLTCAEIRAEITQLQSPDKYPTASIEGSVTRKASKSERITELKAAAWDKNCSK